jgi:hypothetical protein
MCWELGATAISFVLGNYFQPLASGGPKDHGGEGDSHPDHRVRLFAILLPADGIPFQFLSDIRTYSNRIEWQNNFQIADRCP